MFLGETTSVQKLISDQQWKEFRQQLIAAYVGVEWLDFAISCLDFLTILSLSFLANCAAFSTRMWWPPVMPNIAQLFAGNFDNIFWHGLPEKFCLKKTYRAHKNTVKTCDSDKQFECEECLNFQDVHHLPTYFCINPGKHGKQGQCTKCLCPSRKVYPGVKHSLLLNRVSSFDSQMLVSAPTHDTTPYFTVVFVKNNHGSWVEIVAEVISETTDNDKNTLFESKYHHENLDINNRATLTIFHQHLAYFLWIDSGINDPETEDVFSIKMESEFPDSTIQDINAMEWESQVSLSKQKHVFCVSIPGVLSAASITRKGNSKNVLPEQWWWFSWCVQDYVLSLGLSVLIFFFDSRPVFCNWLTQDMGDLPGCKDCICATTLFYHCPFSNMWKVAFSPPFCLFGVVPKMLWARSLLSCDLNLYPTDKPPSWP